MKAESNGGQICRQKNMNKVGNGMIVVGNQGEWRRDRMLPTGVHSCKGRLLRMKSIAMEDVSHHLSLVSALVIAVVHERESVPREGAGRGISLWQCPMASVAQCSISVRSGDAILG